MIRENDFKRIPGSAELVDLHSTREIGSRSYISKSQSPWRRARP